jgi:hypothetical protein
MPTFGQLNIDRVIQIDPETTEDAGRRTDSDPSMGKSALYPSLPFVRLIDLRGEATIDPKISASDETGQRLSCFWETSVIYTP